MLAGPRRGTVLDCADCTARCVHGIELPRRMEAAKKDVLLSGRAAWAVPPSAWNWSTKQPEGQASEEFNGQAGFLRLGLLERPRWPPARVAAKRPCRPRPTRAPRISYARPHGMKITIVSMGAMRTSEPAIFRAAFDKGVNYIDTARGYMDGRNEDGGRSAQRLPRPRTWPPR